MVWQRIKRLFGRGEPTASAEPEVVWVEAAASPWHVRVLDVRPFTLGMLSASENQQCAENLNALARADGTAFIDAAPESTRVVPAGLRYRAAPPLVDGVLFAPQVMEHKWALYLCGRRIVVVRSWTRAVHLVADLEVGDDFVEVVTLRGALFSSEEDPAWTVRAFDALLRTHALELVHPIPLIRDVGDEDLRSAAIWCMSMFGNKAHFATAEALPSTPPDATLRADSRLHIAVARGDADAALRELSAGTPLDLRGRGGLTPLHWSVEVGNPVMLELLLRRGAALDVASESGMTPLMSAVQQRAPALVARLLAAGAAPDTGDLRGFTALHRAAETGQLECVELLLARGAAPDPWAQGHSPRTLAIARDESAIVARLDAAIGPRR